MRKTIFKKIFIKCFFIASFSFITITSNLFAQTVPCNQRVIDDASFTYTGTGATPSRWNISQADTGGASLDQTAFSYVASGNFSNVNLNPNGGTNNSTRQYAVVTNPNTLSPQYANIPTDGMLVINPLQGQNDQYLTYNINGLVPGNTYYIEIKVWNVIDMAMPTGNCGQWCNWNNQLNLLWEGNGNNAQDGQSNMNYSGTNPGGTWNGFGSSQMTNMLKINSGGAYAIITGQMTLGNATTGFKLTFRKNTTDPNPVVLGIDYIKVYGCATEAINISGGTPNVCEASQFTLTAQGIGPAGSSYQWYENGVLLAGRTSDTLNIVSGIVTGVKDIYKAVGQWDAISDTLIPKLCCSSVGGTSDEVYRQSFNNLTYTCTSSTYGPYADLPAGTSINSAYTYAGTTCNNLNDGQYAVVKNSYAGQFWKNRPEVFDHTGVAGSGALFINAIGGVGQNFFQTSLSGLCDSTTYEFSIWYASLAANGEIVPNIEFDVLQGATKVASTSTGVIPVNEQWYEADVTFTTPLTGNPTYTLQAVNLVSGSGGNDLMLDDIVVKKCTPSINLYQNGTLDSIVSVCDNNPVNLTVSTFYNLPLEITGSTTGTVYYQWMSSTSPSGPWTLISTPETTGTFSAIPTSTTTYYRAKVSASSASAATGTVPIATDCGNDAMTNSFTLTKGGNFTIPPITGTTNYCVGATMTLTGDPGTGDQWEWRKGNTSTTATPITGYTYSNNVANKVYSKSFAITDTGNYYFFSKTAAGCESYSTIRVTASTPATPTFTQVAAICAGATLNALPSTSTNGITGSWSPAIDNTTTTTYTFTPTAGQCANTATMTITVNPVVTPTFSAVAGICSGGTLNALPTTSNNGITGTWSPALNNTATTTYTFTPTAGQCATTASMTIAVNSGNVTPAFTQVAPICSGTTLNPLPTTSTNGITGAWSPALNNTATTTYTFTPNAGQCATTTTMSITVNPPTVPTFAGVNPVCSGSTISPLPATSTNGITGTWSPALNNTATTTYTFTPDAGQCATTATLTITVSSSITPVFNHAPAICSGTVLNALPTTSTNGITGTWSPALNNTATTTYTFTPDPGQCGTSTTMTITVNQVPSAPTATTTQPSCTSASGTIMVTVPASGVTYSFDNGNTFQASSTSANLLPTTYQVVVKTTAGGCISPATAVTINPQPVIPVAAQVSIVQPDCITATGIITVTNALNGEMYSFNNGASFQPGATSGSLGSGTYQVVIQNTTGGCLSSATSATIISQPLVPATPAAAIAQPTCTVATGIITVTSPTSGVQYSFNNGVSFQSSATSPDLAANNTYQVVVQGIVGGCLSSATPEVINPQPTVPVPPTVRSPVNYCQHDTTAVPLVATTVAGNTLNWYDASGAIGSVAPTPSTATGGSTTYSVTSFNGTCESPQASITVNIDPISAYAGGPIVDINQGQTITLNGKATGNDITISWSPTTYLSDAAIEDPMLSSVLKDITYTMRVRSPDGCKASDTVHVVLVKDLIIPNAFTPNGDGINDKWIITYLDEYSGATVSVFNRYGQMIFESSAGGYANKPWDGTYNGSPVPIGTYYYIIKPGDGKQPLSGSISVIR